MIFDDNPVAGEPVEYQRRRVPAHADLAMLFAHEEFGHSIVGGGLARGGNPRPGDQREPHGFGPLENQQRVRMIVGEPVGEDFFFVRDCRRR